MRLNELIRYCQIIGANLLIGKYDYDKENKFWQREISGLEKEQERGKRCLVCYKIRLEASALVAKEKHYDLFATELTISPHKDAKQINKIGKKLSQKYEIDFLESDFKKNDAFLHSIDISKQNNLYRQNYCGCKYSKKENTTTDHIH